MSLTRCVCIWRVTTAIADDGGLTLVKIVDDPFCPSHYPDGVLDVPSLDREI